MITFNSKCFVWREGFGILNTGNLKNASHKYHCLECGETEEIWEDLEHNLVFCRTCGTILVFNEIVTDECTRVLTKPELVVQLNHDIEADNEEEARLLFFKWLKSFCSRFIKER